MEIINNIDDILDFISNCSDEDVQKVVIDAISSEECISVLCKVDEGVGENYILFIKNLNGLFLVLIKDKEEYNDFIKSNRFLELEEME